VVTGQPRLLVLASTFPARTNDGTPAFVEDLAEAQARAFDVTVVVPRVPGGARNEVSAAGVKVHRFAYFPRRWEDLADGAIIENLRKRPSRWLQVVPFMVGEAAAVGRQVHRDRPDVIHAHWILPQGLIATLVAPRIPRMVTSLGGDLYALRSKPLRALKQAVVRRATVMTSVNQEMAKEIVRLGADPAHVHVIPMGADLSRFSPQGRVETHDGPTRLLFVGRLVEKKGLIVLLEALRRLPPGTAELTVVGSGPLEASLRQEASGLPVQFLGQHRRDELARDYKTHEILVVPSIPASSGDQDGLPVALLEAMGSGCAVIASDLPGINEAVQDGISGLLVQARDAEDLANAIERINKSQMLRESLSTGAIRRAADFSVDATSREYVDHLTACISL